MAKTNALYITNADGVEVRVTQHLALSYAVDACTAAGAPAEVISVLTKMCDQKKPVERADGATTATEAANAGYAARLLAAMQPNTPVTLEQVADMFGFVNPSTGGANKQKASKVMQVLTSSHQVVKVEKSRPTAYVLA